MASSSSTTKKQDQKLSADAKRARLNEIGRKSFVSDRGKEALINDIKRLGVPEHASKTTFIRARRKECARSTDFGELVQPMMLPLEDGNEKEIHFQHPLAMLDTACKDSPAFNGLMAEMHARKECTFDDPWNLILYNDEVGVSPLSGHDARETQAIYWSIKELGPAILCLEDGWFTIAAIESDIAKQVPGGMSQVCALLLATFFDDRVGSIRTGVFLPIGPEGAFVFARFEILVGDEKALKGILHFRGASSWFPCALCVNLTSRRCPLLSNPWFKAITCTDQREWKTQTDAGARKALTTLRDLADTAISNNQFDLRQKQSGWTYTEFNIILDSNHGVEVTSYMGDWFHIFTVSGVFNLEIVLLINVLAQIPGANFGWHSLQSFCENFTWPKFAKPPHSAFSSPLNDDGVFSGQGSDCLNLYPVLRVYLYAIVLPLGLMLPQIECMLALCKIFDVLLQVSANTVTPRNLDEALRDHAERFAAAYVTMLNRYLPKTPCRETPR